MLNSNNSLSSGPSPVRGAINELISKLMAKNIISQGENVGFVRCNSDNGADGRKSVQILVPTEEKDERIEILTKISQQATSNWNIPTGSDEKWYLNDGTDQKYDGNTYIPLSLACDWFINQDFSKETLYALVKQKAIEKSNEALRRDLKENIAKEIDLNDIEAGSRKDDDISTFADENRFLSNFTPAKVVYNDRDYPSVEHAYQAEKFAYMVSEQISVSKTDLRIDELKSRTKNNLAVILEKNDELEVVSLYNILGNSGLTAGDVKILANQCKSYIDKQWDQKKLSVMISLVVDKFVNNKELQDELLATGDKLIIEGNNHSDSYRGFDLKESKGKNILGKILMMIRKHLKSEQVKTD